jgi:mono/diheme cytochrome c family protein
MLKGTLFLLLILSMGCLQQTVDVEPGPVEVEKRIVEVPYPEEAKSISNPIAASEESLAIGKAKYEVFCSMCHGPKGRGSEEVTKSFSVDPSSLVTDAVKMRSDGELFWATSYGVNDTTMLPWMDLLDDEEIWHLVNYMRILQNEA